MHADIGHLEYYNRAINMVKHFLHRRAFRRRRHPMRFSCRFRAHTDTHTHTHTRACAAPRHLTFDAATISNPQWKRVREIRILAVDIFPRGSERESALEHKKIGRLIANGVHPRGSPVALPALQSRPLRFMEHSVHSIFSIVDRPYLSYLCFS